MYVMKYGWVIVAILVLGIFVMPAASEDDKYYCVPPDEVPYIIFGDYDENGNGNGNGNGDYEFSTSRCISYCRLAGRTCRRLVNQAVSCNVIFANQKRVYQRTTCNLKYEQPEKQYCRDEADKYFYKFRAYVRADGIESTAVCNIKQKYCQRMCTELR